MTDSGPIVIIGGGLSAAKAAEALRAEGFEGPITLIAAEDELPYERPPLSKGFLTGSDERGVIFPHDRAWYDQNRVDLRLGVRATGIDPAARIVTLADGSRVEYDRVLLATGAVARTLPIPGADAANVQTLRAVADSERLKSEISTGDRRVVIIGAGWIGLEVASAARGYGNQVTVIEPQEQPLLAALGPELGAVFADLHREHGVDLRLGTGVAEIISTDGRATGVRTSDGDEVPADLIVVGVGARPETGLAETAGLTIDNGVLVDAALQTSDPHIWAAGDVANVVHPFYGRPLRVEHWSNADASGPAAAKSMLGQAVSFDHLPFFFTDQYDLGMEYTGTSDGADELVYRGDRESREFVVFWLAAGQVIGGMNVNVWDVADQIGVLIRSRAVVDKVKLADPDVPLDQVAG